MKANYICEKCGKIYETPHEAEACEARDTEEERVKKLAEDEKNNRLALINSAVNSYIAEYEEIPRVTITDENIAVICDNKLNKIFKYLY